MGLVTIEPPGQLDEGVELALVGDGTHFKGFTSRNRHFSAIRPESYMPTSIDVFAKAREHERLEQLRAARELDALPYFRVLEGPTLPIVEMEGKSRIMLGSNNYLGLTGDERVKQGALDALNRYGTGLTGSRFLNGTIDLHLELERELADWLGTEGATRLHYRPSGQPRRAGDDPRPGRHRGGRLRRPRLDPRRLHPVARQAAGRSGTTASTGSSRRSRRRRRTAAAILVVVDGVFSMEGDVAPLPEITELCQRFGARLMVDEAHALGVLGARGAGTAELLGVEDRVDLRMATFSKSLASCGGRDRRTRRRDRVPADPVAAVHVHRLGRPGGGRRGAGRGAHLPLGRGPRAVRAGPRQRRATYTPV